MSELLLVTGVLEPSSEVLPALGLLLHSVRVLPADASALVEAPPADVVLVDARRDLAHAKSICRLLHTTGLDCPMLAIVTEGGQDLRRRLEYAGHQQQLAHVMPPPVLRAITRQYLYKHRGTPGATPPEVPLK